MEIGIVDRGDGPKIAGTRITVYDVYYYLINGWNPERIGELFSLSLDQIQCAMKYIEDNKADVMAVHQEVEERNARGNPPEVEAKLAGTRARMQAWLEEHRRRKSQENNGAGNPGGR